MTIFYGRRCDARVAVLNQAYWDRLAGLLQLDPRVPDSFPFYAQPHAVVLTLEPWTIENGLLTPTLKLKRNNLAAHFAAQIEPLYKH